MLWGTFPTTCANCGAEHLAAAHQIPCAELRVYHCGTCHQVMVTLKGTTQVEMKLIKPGKR